MKLKRLGFYKELRHGDKLGMSLIKAIRNYPSEIEDKIVEYLENGVVFCVTPELVFDILDETKGVITNLELLTDGVWVWYSDLAYYVKNYHVELDEEFIQYVQNKKWIMPDEKEFDLLKLSL